MSVDQGEPECRSNRGESTDPDDGEGSSPVHIWKARPLKQAIYWRPRERVSRALLASAYEFFFVQRVLAEIMEHVWSAPAGSSPFGYLVGELCEVPDEGVRYVLVKGCVRSKFPFAEASVRQISGEADAALRLEVGRVPGALVGWYHSHPSGSAVLSDADVATHTRDFGKPWMCTVLAVTDAAMPVGGVFYATREGFSGEQCLPLYEVVDREEVPPRGMLRVRLDWANMFTDQQVVHEPRPRPGPVNPDPSPASGGSALPGSDTASESSDSEEAPVSEAESVLDGEGAPVLEGEGAPLPELDIAAFATGLDRFELPPPRPEIEAEAKIGMDPVGKMAMEFSRERSSGRSAPGVGAFPNGGYPLWRRQLGVVAGSFAMVVVIGFSLVAVVRWAKPGAPALGSGQEEDEVAPSSAVAEAPASRVGEAPAARADEAPPAAVPTRETPAAALKRFDRLSDALLSEISRYYGVVVALDDGRAGCTELGRAYVRVEDAWMAYSEKGKTPLKVRLDPERAARDGRLFAGVQDAERLFGESGCERP